MSIWLHINSLNFAVIPCHLCVCMWMGESMKYIHKIFWGIIERKKYFSYNYNKAMHC